jgi:SNF2-related domain/Helicase conserved C-terminal domain/Myb-like DNA-binding domain
VQDSAAFRRKRWQCLILDEAQNIKNFRSRRWQTLLHFNAEHRLLLTGTPLQNNLMELWSLLHFLMPSVFASHQDFKEWFSRPVDEMIEGAEQFNRDLIDRLHGVLRPFILRRLKRDVEQQMPRKYEHIVPCTLSKRQRHLYDEFMRASATRRTLSSGSYVGVVNVLMQLRKVCNHPDLFEERPIVSSFDQRPLAIHVPSASLLDDERFRSPSAPTPLAALGIDGAAAAAELRSRSRYAHERRAQLIVPLDDNGPAASLTPASLGSGVLATAARRLEERRAARRQRSREARERARRRMLCSSVLVYGAEALGALRAAPPPLLSPRRDAMSTPLRAAVRLPKHRAAHVDGSMLREVIFVTKALRAPAVELSASHRPPSAESALRLLRSSARVSLASATRASSAVDPLRPIAVRQQLYFPDKGLIQYDCGKLQKLATLLRYLMQRGSRALIFTQMSRMLDVLERFLSYHDYKYFRLDGATRIDRRQMLMERFNADPRIFCMILSTRSGGVGVNLTGADTVIFYDSDWNPAMDAQAQDRCHRIGQTRDVHIYRLISEHTVEENILKKANQKRFLNQIVVQDAGFTADFFKKIDLRELIDESEEARREPRDNMVVSRSDWQRAVALAEDDTDVRLMKEAERERDAIDTEFQQLGSGAGAGDDDDDDEEQNIGADAKGKQEIVEREGQESQVDRANGDDHGDDEESVIMSALTPVERYGYRFLDTVDPVVDADEIDERERQVDVQHERWRKDMLHRLQDSDLHAETLSAMNDDDEEEEEEEEEDDEEEDDDEEEEEEEKGGENDDNGNDKDDDVDDSSSSSSNRNDDQSRDDDTSGSGNDGDTTSLLVNEDQPRDTIRKASKLLDAMGRGKVAAVDDDSTLSSSSSDSDEGSLYYEMVYARRVYADQLKQMRVFDPPNPSQLDFVMYEFDDSGLMAHDKRYASRPHADDGDEDCVRRHGERRLDLLSSPPTGVDALSTEPLFAIGPPPSVTMRESMLFQLTDPASVAAATQTLPTSSSSSSNASSSSSSSSKRRHKKRRKRDDDSTSDDKRRKRHKSSDKGSSASTASSKKDKKDKKRTKKHKRQRSSSSASHSSGDSSASRKRASSSVRQSPDVGAAAAASGMPARSIAAVKRSLLLGNYPKWMTDEDRSLVVAYQRYGGNWELVSDVLNAPPNSWKRDRTPKSCYHHYRAMLMKLQNEDTTLDPRPAVLMQALDERTTAAVKLPENVPAARTSSSRAKLLSAIDRAIESRKRAQVGAKPKSAPTDALPPAPPAPQKQPQVAVVAAAPASSSTPAAAAAAAAAATAQSIMIGRAGLTRQQFDHINQVVSSPGAAAATAAASPADSASPRVTVSVAPPQQWAPPAGSTDETTAFAYYCVTLLPSLSARVQEIMRGKTLSDKQRIALLASIVENSLSNPQQSLSPPQRQQLQGALHRMQQRVTQLGATATSSRQ